MLRIDRERERADFLVTLAEREGIDRLAGREVDDLEVLLIGVLNVEPCAVLDRRADHGMPVARGISVVTRSVASSMTTIRLA